MFKFLINLAIVLMLIFLGYSYMKKDSGVKSEVSKDTVSKSDSMHSVEGSERSNDLKGDVHVSKEDGKKNLGISQSVEGHKVENHSEDKKNGDVSTNHSVEGVKAVEGHKVESEPKKNADVSMNHSKSADMESKAGAVAHSSDAVSSSKSVVSTATSNAGQPIAIGQDFSLKDQNGVVVNSKELRGKFILISFGYLSCKEICPAIMATMSSILDRLDEATNSMVVPIMVNIDSDEHDSAESIKKHNFSFDSRIHFLSGSAEEVQNLVKGYKVYVGKKDNEGQMDHSGYIYLMGVDSKYFTHFSVASGLNKADDDFDQNVKRFAEFITQEVKKIRDSSNK